jgi:DNA-binding response OmpR family regulator
VAAHPGRVFTRPQLLERVAKPQSIADTVARIEADAYEVQNVS